MKLKTVFLFILTVFSGIINAQNSLITPNGVSFPSYNSGNRPAANSVGIGTVLYNSTDNSHQYSNGSTWLNLLGTTTLPSGTENQTLRNNGSGWVADGFLQNYGNKVNIGPDPPLAGLLNVGGNFGGWGLDVRTYAGNGIRIQSNLLSLNVQSSGSQNTVYALNTSNGTALEGNSTSGIGIVASSGSNYSGQFIGRVLVSEGTTGFAGIDFANLYQPLQGYVGMNGNTEMGIFGYGLNNWVQRWNVYTGAICYATTPTICSDIRLKKDLKPLHNSILRIDKLNAYNYYWKNEKMVGLQTGFMAQEIREIFPELVKTDSQGYLSVDYIGLVPHLVESVKALKSENEDLKVRLLKIENFLKMLDKKNEAENSKR